MKNNRLLLADIYTFLAMAASYPEAHSWTHSFFEMYLQLLAELEMQRFHDQLRSELRAADMLTQLQAEHTRLFITAYPHVVAPPFASSYLSPDAFATEQHLAALGDFYRAKGVETSQKGEMPDQLSVQLEFLGHLEARNDRAGADEFLEKFFRPWFAPFRDRLAAGTTNPFYLSLGQAIDFLTR